MDAAADRSKELSRYVRLFKPKRILHRIVVPFTFLFGLATFFSWLLSAYFISLYVDRDLTGRMEQVAGIISRASFVLNPAILENVKVVANAEIVLFDRKGRIITTTFADLDSAGQLEQCFLSGVNTPFAARDITIGATRYRYILRPLALQGYENAVLSLWIPLEEADSLKRKIILVLGGVAALGIVALSTVSYLIARTITAPVEELVNVTEKLSRGNFAERAAVASSDEIGMLANSFNRMIGQLQSYEQKLIESEKLAVVGQMAAGLAHEVRNPLTSIKMLVQILLGRMRDNPESGKMLASLLAEIDRLDRIIGQIVERTKAGELQRQPVDINKVLGEVLQLANESLKSGNICVTLNAEREMPLVAVDPEKIKQVFWNLLVNARDAMPNGGTLTVSSRQTGPDSLEIVFEDTGTGLGSRDPEELFRSFVTTKPEGLGLGLSMSRKIIERHGGALVLENRGDGGARAKITLPIGGDGILQLGALSSPQDNCMKELLDNYTHKCI